MDKSKPVTPSSPRRLTLGEFYTMVSHSLFEHAPGDADLDGPSGRVRVRELDDLLLLDRVTKAFDDGRSGVSLRVDRGWTCEVTLTIDLRLDHYRSSKDQIVFEPEYLIGTSGSQRSLAQSRTVARALEEVCAICEAIEGHRGGHLIARPYDDAKTEG